MSEKLEDAKMRLAGAACMYAAGHALRVKCPQLDEYECFKRTMIEAGAKLKEAANAYYEAACADPGLPSK